MQEETQETKLTYNFLPCLVDFLGEFSMQELLKVFIQANFLFFVHCATEETVRRRAEDGTKSMDHHCAQK